MSDKIDNVGGGGDCKDKIDIRSLFKNSNGATEYLDLKTRLAFTQLRKAFSKALIFQQFDLKYHIWIETNTSSYAIGEVSSQLTLDNLGQWHLIVFYSQKIISAKTRYQIHNNELLAIVKSFKTWKHYLEDC